jgi:hypothetical protein
MMRQRIWTMSQAQHERASLYGWLVCTLSLVVGSASAATA